MPKVMTDPISQNRESRQHRVHDFGVMLPILPDMGYMAISLNLLKVQGTLSQNGDLMFSLLLLSVLF